MATEATAYHEAGHAVMTLWHQRSFAKATIEASGDYPEARGDYLGLVIQRKTRLDIDSLGHSNLSKVRRWAEPRAQLSLAGYVAERHYTGRENNVRAARDFLMAHTLGRLANDDSSNETVVKWLEWQLAVTAESLLNRAGWMLVEKGAMALLEHGTLTGARFKELVLA